ncbi:uncharacterized protein EV420DRAFT_1552201 [Desarmillaria tabescens]|uniref:Peptidase C14 caspase domain-containing protein n=1 Tax=Armillaria tabescens TaxID=1929756 RepID=A0AA39KB69_ARMTA|nr:uncharacterized protein EV420DRAFT_1552201 [Desarmillaria tabescens]KAK0455608.1 hypothetical protein EV420DRAFT_1552201 [Desarmillaria tabescens]
MGVRKLTTFDAVICALAKLVDRQDVLEEAYRLKRLVRWLAQEYEIGFAEDTDSMAVLQEAERRSRSLGERSVGYRIPSVASLREAFNKIDAELKRLGPHGSHSLTQGVRYGVGLYRFWAVLIGIDAYPDYLLRGCVSDALLMKRFLTDDLGVPENRIQCLLGSKYTNSDDPKSTPSHANIVDMLYSLANNPEIERGDSIIVYFAGVGGHYRCLEHPDTGKCPSSFCPTEVLFPIDHGTQDASGQRISGISDRELNSLFALICRAKGPKITFIVDSDYSGGVSRRQQQEIPSISKASLKSMLHAADERWKYFSGYRSVLSKDWRPDMYSCVILAAGFSYEVKGTKGCRGVFTETLLRVLRSTDWKKEMTYADLVNLMSRSLSSTSQQIASLPFSFLLVSGRRMNKRLWY